MNTTCSTHHHFKSSPVSLENPGPSSDPRPRPLQAATRESNFLDRTRQVLAGMVLCALLAFSGATAMGQTHPFETSSSGHAQFIYDTNVPVLTLLWAQQIDIDGFSNKATAVIHFDGAEPVGALTGFFYAYRHVGNGGKRSVAEHLFGSVSGTSINVGTGMYYEGTITITSGTGRLEGATGTISFQAFQHGFIEPVFVTSPNQVPMEITYLGAFTLPKPQANE
jgi:hypothetical protein